MPNAMQIEKGKGNAFLTGLADYSGASLTRREYEKQRKKVLLSDPGSWPYRSFADWKSKQ